MTYKKGQRVICRYDGKRNGDVIMGVIQSVRNDGHVIIGDLLTPSDKPRLKRVDVLRQRNVVVSAAESNMLLSKYRADEAGSFRAMVAQYAKRKLGGETVRVMVGVLRYELPKACVGRLTAELTKMGAIHLIGKD